MFPKLTVLFTFYGYHSVIFRYLHTLKFNCGTPAASAASIAAVTPAPVFAVGTMRPTVATTVQRRGFWAACCVFGIFSLVSVSMELTISYAPIIVAGSTSDISRERAPITTPPAAMSSPAVAPPTRGSGPVTLPITVAAATPPPSASQSVTPVVRALSPVASPAATPPAGAERSEQVHVSPAPGAFPSGSGVCAAFAPLWSVAVDRYTAQWRATCDAFVSRSSQSGGNRCRVTLADVRTLNASAFGYHTQPDGTYGQAIYVLILNATAYTFTPASVVNGAFPWVLEMARLLLDALDDAWDAAGAPPLPVGVPLGFVISAFDFPQCNPGSMRTRSPLPVLSVATVPTSKCDIAVPGSHMLSARQQLRNLDGGATGDGRPPWAARVAKAIFRGMPTCSVLGRENQHHCSRIIAWQHSASHPDVLDVGLTGRMWFSALSNMTPARSVPIRDHANFKYALALDGATYSRRFAEVMATGSAILLQRSQYEEFFFPALTDGVHYTGLDCNGTACPLVETVEYLRAHDDYAHATGDAALKFMRTYLSPAGTACYWRALLAKLAPFMAIDVASAAALARTLPRLVPSGEKYVTAVEALAGA